MNLAVDADVRGYVTVSIHNVSVEHALSAILSPLGYVAQRLGDVYYVHLDRHHGTAAPVAPTTTSVVLPVALIRAQSAASTLRALYPQAAIRVDRSANALLVAASAEDVQGIRTVLQGIDVRSSVSPSVEAITLQTPSAARIAARLSRLFGAASITAASPRSLIVRAAAPDLAQIKTLAAALDAPAPAASATPASASEAVRVTQRKPSEVGRALARQFPHLRVSVSGPAVLLAGTPDDVAKAKALVEQIDVAPFGARYTQVYRVRSFDAASVAALLAKSFPDAAIAVDRDLNALSVTAPVADQRRIGDAIAQLDAPPPASQGAAGAHAVAGGGNVEVISLRSAVPAGQGGPDVQGGLVQALQSVVPTKRSRATWACNLPSRSSARCSPR